MVLVSGDLVDITEDLMGRVAQLEQRITSPYFTIPNGSTPTFPSINVGEWRGAGSAVPIQQLISTPTGLTGQAHTTFTDVAIDASWIAPADASAVQYQIDIAVKDTQTGIYSLIDSRTTSGTTAHISNLDPGKTYGIKVSGINRIGVVSAPTPAAGWYDVATLGDPSIPVAPTGVTPTAGTTSVMLTWDDNTEADVARGAGYYEVQYDTNAAFSAPKTISTSATMASFAGLTSGVPYYFRVRARDSSNNPGPFSGTVSATPGTAGGGGAAPSDGNPPASSPTPSTVQGGAGWLYAKWVAVVNVDPVTYDVHISTTNGFTPDATTKVMETSATSAFIKTLADGTALAYGTTYYVKLVARDRDGSAGAGGQGSGTLAQVTTGDIAAGSITATSGIIVSLDAGAITTGTLDASRISVTNLNATSILGGTITSDKINATVGLDATLIKFNTMSGDRIAANTLDITAIKTSTLAARTITLASDGAIVGGTNPLGTGSAQTGFVLNGGAMTTFKGGASTFRLDFSTGDAFFAGNLTGSTGTFSGTVSGGTIIGGVIETSSSSTVDRIYIDPTVGLRLDREATTNLNPEPYFGRIWSGDEYQAQPGDTSVLGSAYSIFYPAGYTYNGGTGLTINVQKLPPAVQGYPQNPIGSPWGCIQWAFTSTAAAGPYRIYFETATVTPGLSYAASFYQAVSNIAAGGQGGYLQFLDAGGINLLTVNVTRLRDGAAQGVFSTANVWERFGATGIAPAGTVKMRIGVFAANLTAVGSWVGNSYIYGLQLEQKDHVSTYCDGNQYGCVWTSGRPGSTSTRAYAPAGLLGVQSNNYIVGSHYGGFADQVFAGRIGTYNMPVGTTAYFPHGGGVVIGAPPTKTTTTAPSDMNSITFLPYEGQWQSVGVLPSIYYHEFASVSGSPNPGGYEYVGGLTMHSGYAAMANSLNNYASIDVRAGSADPANTYGGTVTLTASGTGGTIECAGIVHAQYAMNVEGNTTINAQLRVNQPTATTATLILYTISGGTSPNLASRNAAGTTVAQITNTGNVQGTGAYTTMSDARAKDRINYIDKTGALAKIMALKPATFQYTPNLDPNQKIHLGFVAQDLQGIIDEAINPIDTSYDERDQGGDAYVDVDPLLGIQNDAIIATLVAAVQELATLARVNPPPVPRK